MMLTRFSDAFSKRQRFADKDGKSAKKFANRSTSDAVKRLEQHASGGSVPSVKLYDRESQLKAFLAAVQTLKEDDDNEYQEFDVNNLFMSFSPNLMTRTRALNTSFVLSNQQDHLAEVICGKKHPDTLVPIIGVNKQWLSVKDTSPPLRVFPVVRTVSGSGKKKQQGFLMIHEVLEKFEDNQVELFKALMNVHFLTMATDSDKPYLVDLEHMSFMSLAKDDFVEGRNSQNIHNKISVNSLLVRFISEFDPKHEACVIALAAPTGDVTVPMLRVFYDPKRIIVPNPVGRDAFDLRDDCTVVPELVGEAIGRLAEEKENNVRLPSKWVLCLDYCCTFYSNSASKPILDLWRLFNSGLVTGEGCLLWITLCCRKEARNQANMGTFNGTIESTVSCIENMAKESGHDIRWKKLPFAGHHNPALQCAEDVGVYTIMYYAFAEIYKV